MKATAIILIASTIAGCGPLLAPMPIRPEAKQQEKIDQGWERALGPVNKLTRQEWLDLFVGAQIYQYGVDKLQFRSEKKFSGGLVVMEIRYDRFRPNDDLFEVRVLDDAGNLLRKEQYTRKDVETTFNDLCVDVKVDGEVVQQAEKEKRIEFERQRQARWDKIAETFPDIKVGKKAGK